MIAILIFAGRSTRFWPLGEKSFFPIWGSCLLERQVGQLKAAGFKEKDILLVGGSHNIAEAKRMFPRLIMTKQKDLSLGMRGALLSALPRCKTESVLIVSANDSIDASAYRTLREQAKTRKEGGLILARKVQHYFPGGYLTVKGKRILGIVEKPKEGKEPSKLVNIVAHVHTNASLLLRTLRTTPHTNDDGYEQALDRLFKSYPYEAVTYTGTWQPVKYPWHLLDLLQKIIPPVTEPSIPKSCVVHPSAVIEGAVVLGEGVRVMAHATIVGPCFIGRGSVIANNALVRGSSVGEQCVIGYNTEIARSILANNVWTHSSYLGDSVVGSNTSFGAGSTTGNLRLDEEMIFSDIHGAAVSTQRVKLGAIIGQHCRAGIHTCFAPGVKIGAGSFLSSKELLTTDIPDCSFVKNGLVRPNKKRSVPTVN